MEDNENLPWYRDSRSKPPFQLTTYFKNTRGVEYRFVSLFPWTLVSFHSLLGFDHSDVSNDWPKFIETYAGSIVVGTKEELYLVRLRPSDKQRKQIRLQVDTKGRPITAVTWALSRGSPLDPLLVIAMSSMICVYSVGCGGAVGFLRGHGGPISSIAVHPRVPSYICTTSSDQTARIYDLDGSPDTNANQVNPFWIPGTGPSMAGAPHGLLSSEKEEWGRGRFITVLVGGRSGGHIAAVTCAAFHPTFPLVATGGMDRVVKIWRVHVDQGQLLREDKPLFSSSLVHRSSAASVVWLSEDTLLTHCTSTAFASHIEILNEQDEQRSSQATQDEDDVNLPEKVWFGCPGRIVILRWLGLNRFFPPAETRYRSIQRGCVSDYQDSSSFTVIASIPLPYFPETPHLRVFGDFYHDHIALIAHQKTIHLLNASLVPAVETSEFPTDPEEFPHDVTAQARHRTEENIDNKWFRDNKWVRGLGWRIALDPRLAVDEHINAVDMGLNGEMIMAVGTKGSIWIWMKDP